MPIEVEFFTLTGMQGSGGETGILELSRYPSTGVDGNYDIAIDPVDGPAQVLGVDFGITHYGGTAKVFFDLPNSDIKDVLLNGDHGITTPLRIRALYNGETGI